MLCRFRKAEARIEQKEQWARLRKFKAAARASLGNKTRSGGGEIPNSRQADHSCEKADHENVEGMGVGVVQMSRQHDRCCTLHEFVGVGHSILLQHEENRKAPPGFAL